MASPHDPWTFFTGDTWQIQVTLGDEAGDPIDISGASQITWLLNSADGENNHFQLGLGNGVTILDGPNGIAGVTLSKERSKTLSPGYYQDMVILEIAGLESTQIFGVIEAKKRLQTNKSFVPNSGQLAWTMFQSNPAIGA